jgi:hypothetical protein
MFMVVPPRTQGRCTRDRLARIEYTHFDSSSDIRVDRACGEKLDAEEQELFDSEHVSPADRARREVTGFAFVVAFGISRMSIVVAADPCLVTRNELRSSPCRKNTTMP